MKLKKIMLATILLLAVCMMALTGCQSEEDKAYEAADKVTVSVEAFVIGNGYVVTPITIGLTDAVYTEMATMFFDNTDIENMKSELNATNVIIYAIKKAGFDVQGTGAINPVGEEGGYFISKVTGFNHTNKIPTELKAKYDADLGVTQVETASGSGLGNGDYAQYAGWMTTINNVVPMTSTSEIKVKKDDVIRMQFSLAFGAEFGYCDWEGANNYYEKTNKDSLTKYIAKLVRGGDTTSDKYKNAVAAAAKLAATQSEINAICA